MRAPRSAIIQSSLCPSKTEICRDGRQACALALLQFRCGAGQDLDDLGFRFSVIAEALGRDLAQVLERRPHERRHPAAVLILAAEATAHARNLLADGGKALEHSVDEVAIVVEIRPAFVGDGVKLLGAFRLRRDVAGLLEISQRRVNDARTRRVPAGGLFLEHLDDLVAVARLLGDERERDQAQVALRQHAPGTHHVAVPAVTSARAVTSAPAVTSTPAAPAGPFSAKRGSTGMSHTEHVGLLALDISLDTPGSDIAQDISYS